MKEILKSRLIEAIEHGDIYMAEVKKVDQELREMSANMNTKDKPKDELEQIAKDYMKLSSKSMFLNEDTTKHFHKLMTLYSLAIEADATDYLSEKDKERLEYLLENNVPYYVVNKGKLEAVEKGMLEDIMDNYFEEHTDGIKGIIETVKKNAK